MSKNIDHRTRDEVMAAVGIADEYYDDLKVACYKLDKLERHRLILFLGVLPVGYIGDGDGLRFAMIRFDEHDRAVELKITIRPGAYDYYWPEDVFGSDPVISRKLMREVAEKWINTK